MDKSKLLNQAEDTEVVHLPSGAGDVTVRSVSHGAMKRGKAEHGEDSGEEVIISAGLVDPELTVEEARKWLESGKVGDTSAVLEAISRLSGATEGAAKSNVRAVRKRRA